MSWVVDHPQEQSEEEQFGIVIQKIDGELVHEGLEDLEQLEAAIHIEVGQVLQHVVNMLLDAFLFQRVLQNKLDEDVGADGASRARDVCHHHFFDLLHQVVKVRAQESSIDDSLQALEHVALRREAGHIGFDDQNQSFDLGLR